MRWEGERESENVEDRRGISAGGLVAGGGIGTVVLALVVMLLGGNPQDVLQQVQSPRSGPAQGGNVQASPEEQRRAKFVRVILADTEDVWHKIFSEKGLDYAEPKLVMFTQQVDSACGTASAAVGPFYCGGDQKVYIDLSFYDELQQRFGAPGEFAQAYVIAHEVGHHVQNLLGTMDKVHKAESRMSERDRNQLSVRLELQADYYAGLWAHYTQQMKNNLTDRDIRDGLQAANAIGDDTLQRQAQGYVVPDAFTHGSSEQRMRWFTKGWKQGTLEGGDTFNADPL